VYLQKPGGPADLFTTVAPAPSPDDALTSLHVAVRSYLSTLLAMADCMSEASPQVGGPYRHRLTRLEKRLAFDASKEAIEVSCSEVAKELRDYSVNAAAYLRSHGVELRRALASLEEIVRALSQRQDFYAARLRQLAAQMERAGAAALTEDGSTPPELLEEAIASHTAGMKSCVESMCHDGQSMMSRIREELAAVEQRLAELEITDPITGLTNRREMERRIRAAAADGTPVLIRFDAGDPFPDEVARQVGARIGSQFRYKDVVCRWSDHEFLVLFQGGVDVAHTRLAQVLPWVAGRYLLENGEIFEVHVEANLVGLEVLEEAAPQRG